MGRRDLVCFRIRHKRSHENHAKQFDRSMHISLTSDHGFAEGKGTAISTEPCRSACSDAVYCTRTHQKSASISSISAHISGEAISRARKDALTPHPSFDSIDPLAVPLRFVERRAASKRFARGGGRDNPSSKGPPHAQALDAGESLFFSPSLAQR